MNFIKEVLLITLDKCQPLIALIEQFYQKSIIFCEANLGYGTRPYRYLIYGYIHSNMIAMKDKESHTKKRPSNLLVWVFTIYTGLYSIAYQRYENRVNRLYISFSSYVEQFDEKTDKTILEGFMKLQSRGIPEEPRFFLFWTTLTSLISCFNEPFEQISMDISKMAPIYVSKNPINILNFKTGEKITYDFNSKKVFDLSIINSEVKKFSVLGNSFNDYKFADKIMLRTSIFKEFYADTLAIKIIGTNIFEKFTVLNSVVVNEAHPEIQGNIKPIINVDSIDIQNTNFRGLKIIVNKEGKALRNKFYDCDISLRIDAQYENFLKLNSFIGCRINGGEIEDRISKPISEIEP